MKTHITNRNGSRGVALITTLLLLTLFTVMTLAMVIATTSDTLIDGYYNNFRGSFYAADSGVNAARQYLINQFSAAVPANWSPASGTPPVSAGTGSTILSNLVNATNGLGAYNSTTGSQTNSWPGKFKIDNGSLNTTLTYLGCVAGPYTGTVDPCSGGDLSSDTSLSTITYTYKYQLMSWGESRANEQNEVVETGDIAVVVSANTSTTSTQSFAAFGTLLNSYPICSSPFVTGTMTGPFFSNGSWNFGDSSLVGSGKYIFTSSVGAASADVGYMYSDGTCNQSANTSNTHKGTTINPTFQSGLNLGQPAIPMPSDTFSQQRAVLDGLGDCAAAGASQTCTSPTQTDRASVLRNAAGNSWPSTGSEPSSGVYLPMAPISGTSCPCTYTGGGIYVQGNAGSMVLTAASPTISGKVHSQQVFTITQSTKTTTVTVDLTSNQTTISDTSGNSQTVTGVPMNNNTGTEAAMAYVNGGIGTTNPGSSGNTGLSGPSSGAAIQDGSAVSVTATGNITVTGSITYKEEPVTFAASGSTPADTPIPANNKGQVLGIYTSGGDIQLAPNSSNQNMEIDASLAMIGTSSSGGLIAAWNQINTFTVVGGRIAMQAKQGNMNTRNIWFDTRFGQNSFAPPWFPATTVTTTGTNTYSWTVSPNRMSWANTTAM